MRFTRKEKELMLSLLSEAFVRMGEEGLEGTAEFNRLDNITEKLSGR